MPPVIQTTDQMELVSTSAYPLGKFPFENFNPVQSRVFDYYDKDCSLVVASSTSSGKTIVAELIMAHTVRVRKKKAMFLSPMRALAQEKYDDWTSENHHFSDLKVSICTGDYRLTPSRKEELEKADVIVMSSEMLNHRCRNLKSEHSQFLHEIGCLVSDETHLLTVPGRGDHLEHGLMKFTEINPECRLVLLSATMPNVEEIADWVSYILTKRDTTLIRSNYRPCPLNMHYEKYWEEQSYEDNELAKVNLALEIVEHYPEDKFLIFAHTKRTGELMKQAVTKAGIQCEFHSADLDKAKRISLEKKFKEDKKFRILIATNTMAWGVNCPARRVIILGVHRGMSEVATYDITQECGRAGRPAYDPVGDVYVLLPEKTFDMHKARLKKPQRIESQMLDKQGEKHKVLAFHLVSEIHHGNIKDKDDVHHWYKRSLACFQSHEFDDSVVDGVMDLLRKCGAVWQEENGTYSITTTGKIASLFYYSPFDVSDLKKNFTNLFDNSREKDDFHLSFALGNVDTQKSGIVSRVEREEMGSYAAKINRMYDNPWEPAVKAGFAYHLLLNGRSNQHLAATTRGLQFDFPRLCQVLFAIDGFSGKKWDRTGWLKTLQTRITYGVSSNIAPLCAIDKVGKVRATKLYQVGMRTVEDVVKNESKIASLLGTNKELTEEILTSARKLVGK